jgi:hypothetical protein
MDGLVTEGVLRKSHAGKPFRVSNHLRFFVTEGFTVFYYADSSISSKATVKGHFDLRNVTSVAPAVDVDEDAIDVYIWVGDKKPPKHLTISFEHEPETRDAWLRHWCSAIKLEYIDVALAQYRDEWLVGELDNSYGESTAISAHRSLFSSKPPTTRVLTPRRSSADLTDEPMSEDSAGPRQRALGRGKSAAPNQMAEMRAAAGLDEVIEAAAPSAALSGKWATLSKQPSNKVVTSALRNSGAEAPAAAGPVRSADVTTRHVTMPQQAVQAAPAYDVNYEPISRSARMRHAKCDALVAAFLEAQKQAEAGAGSKI